MAAISEVSICNMALSELGERKRISSLDDLNSEPARICDLHYAQVRDSLLEAFTFNFASKAAELSKSADVDPIGEYSGIFELPTDCLRVVKMFETNSDYEIKGRQLFTHDGAVKIKYISKETNPVKFSKLFVEALIKKLAARMADSISGSRERKAQLLIEFREIWKEAKLRDSQERKGSRTISRGPSFRFKTRPIL